METDLQRRAEWKNDLLLLVFSILMGAAAGWIIWVYLRAVGWMMGLLWEYLPGRLSFRWYPLIVCLAGGLFMGILHLRYPHYPEDMETVMRKVECDRHYDYQHMPCMLLAAFIPLVVGASVGPEAGMVGVIAGLCCWVGDNIHFAKAKKDAYSRVGAAAALGVLFSAPLFGILSVAEEGESIPQEQRKESRSFMLITYGLAMAGGLGVFRMLSEHFGKVMSDFLSFGAVEMTRMDYMMIPVYALAGTLVFILYDLSDKLMIFLTRWIPVPIRELLGGIVLGICGMFIPMLMFSGEAQMEELMAELSNYTPAFLLAICLLKLALTSFCIRSGLRGGYIFAVLFAGTCMGFCVAMQVFGEAVASHAAFAAALVNAAALGGLMKKPVAASVLLLLCFPPAVLFYSVLAASAGSFVGRKLNR